jgi:translocation protein SEC63
MQYQYDDSGSYFYYFLSSVLIIVLVPWTASILNPTPKVHKHGKLCHCDACKQRQNLIDVALKQESKISWQHIILGLGWLVFCFSAFKAYTTPTGEVKLWDPFEILGIGESSTTQEVKKAFRKASLQWHPDKVESDMKDEAEKKYVELTKAYKALTDEDARKNWEEYGHPDGKQSFSMGIALPSWIVQGSSRYKLLALYSLVFGLGLPWFVGRWWRSTKIFTRDGILNDTMAQFYHEMKESLNQKQLIELLATADEFQTTTPVASKLGASSPILTYLARGMTPPTPEQLSALQKLVKEEMEEKLGSADKLERPKRFMSNNDKSIVTLRKLDGDRCWKAYLLLMAHIVRAPLDAVLDKGRFLLRKTNSF